MGSSQAWCHGCSPSIAPTEPQHWKIVAGEWLQWRWYTVIQWISEIAHEIAHGDRPRDSNRSFQASWCWRRPATFAQDIPSWTWFPSRRCVAELLDCDVDNLFAPILLRQGLADVHLCVCVCWCCGLCVVCGVFCACCVSCVSCVVCLVCCVFRRLCVWAFVCLCLCVSPSLVHLEKCVCWHLSNGTAFLHSAPS